MIILAALFIAICKTQICAKKGSMKLVNMSLPISTAAVIGGGPNRACSTRHARTERAYGRRSFCRRSRFPVKTKTYTVTELESATNKYSEENLLGEGSLGSVYKAEFPDGQV